MPRAVIGSDFYEVAVITMVQKASRQSRQNRVHDGDCFCSTDAVTVHPPQVVRDFFY
jgi:hypothetical protein